MIEAVTQPGGFSPGAAARLRLDTERRAFVKAVGPELNPDSPAIYRAQAQIAAALPASVAAPRLLGSLDEDGWVLLLFEDIDGTMPAQPWRPGELDRVLAAVADLAAALTPAPIAARSAAESHAADFRGWRLLAEAAATGADDLSGLDPWARDHLPALADLEAGWADAAQGSTLAHSDLRADNILLTRNGVVFVDWPWACQAAPWFDLLMMLPSVAMAGGPPPEGILAVRPVSRAADPAAVTAVLAALAGYFIRQSRQPPPPGLPTLRHPGRPGAVPPWTGCRNALAEDQRLAEDPRRAAAVLTAGVLTAAVPAAVLTAIAARPPQQRAPAAPARPPRASSAAHPPLIYRDHDR